VPKTRILRRILCLLFNISLGILICARIASAQTPPSLILSFDPPDPSVTASAPLGTVVATITASWNDGSPFTGTLSFGPPYNNDGGVFAISGNNLIINPAGPGISADASTTQNVTLVATQTPTGTGLPISPDGTALSAPSNGSLTTAAGIWTFGSTQPQPGQYEIFLNGTYVPGGGWAGDMEVNNGGQLYVLNTYLGSWYVWNNDWFSSPAPISPDGTALTVPSTLSLTTAAGIWTFGAMAPQAGQYTIFLNGTYASGWAAAMEVNSGGQLYVYNSSGGGSWWIWNNGWPRSTAPISPDGTALTAPSTLSLTTAAGIWTFGAMAPQAGQYTIFLNGTYVSGWAAEMEVNNDGQLYAYNSSGGGSWWIWNYGWSQSAAP
jgi:hypothetical protein